MLFLLFIVPTGPPVNVELQSVTSTSAVISWREPSPDQHNGILLGYSVTVTNAKETIKLQINTTKIFVSDVVLSPLKPFTTYNVSAAAATINGTGPLSSPLEFTTAQAGQVYILEVNMACWQSCVQVC